MKHRVSMLLCGLVLAAGCAEEPQPRSVPELIDDPIILQGSLANIANCSPIIFPPILLTHAYLNLSIIQVWYRCPHAMTVPKSFPLVARRGRHWFRPVLPCPSNNQRLLPFHIRRAGASGRLLCGRFEGLEGMNRLFPKGIRSLRRSCRVVGASYGNW